MFDFKLLVSMGLFSNVLISLKFDNVFRTCIICVFLLNLFLF
jgi:hypothetical protein